MATMGLKYWAITEGSIPGESTAPASCKQPVMILSRPGTCPRRVGAAFAAVLVVLLALAFPALAAVVRIDRISVTVSDLTRTEKFYRDALGFETARRGREDDPRFARLLGVEGTSFETLTMRLGAQEVEFIKFEKNGRQYPPDSHSRDLWFQHFAIVVGDMDEAFSRLQRVGFTPISVGGPQTLPPLNGSVRAFKFRDPDGHPLELLHFPPGQGRPIWHHQARDHTFLGIDHSAIGISDTSVSLAFYADTLGMTQAYATTNRGPAQEALDGTLNAVVRITGLRPIAADGPGIEFLDYRMPPTGRPAPADTASNDLVHVHLSLRVDALEEQMRSLSERRARFVSPGIVTLKDGRRGAMVRDPDGHFLLLEQGAVDR
jgi:catechol 2,3-dioxygenase-like lactoylglutathione lyase family enzyme